MDIVLGRAGRVCCRRRRAVHRAVLGGRALRWCACVVWRRRDCSALAGRRAETERRERGRDPAQDLGAHGELRPREHAQVLLDELWCDREDVLALPVADEAEALQRRHDVLRADRGADADVADADVAAVPVQHLQQHLRPVRAVAQRAQVAQRLLGAPHLALALRQLVCCLCVCMCACVSSTSIIREEQIKAQANMKTG